MRNASFLMKLSAAFFLMAVVCDFTGKYAWKDRSALFDILE